MPEPSRLRLIPRTCKYCRAAFTPTRAQGRAAKFCCPNHRKAYWRYGGLPFDKMMDRIRRELPEIVRDIVREELAKVIDGRRVKALE